MVVVGECSACGFQPEGLGSSIEGRCTADLIRMFQRGMGDERGMQVAMQVSAGVEVNDVKLNGFAGGG